MFRESKRFGHFLRERDPELVLKDVRQGKVSVERARDLYGVVIDTERWTVDEAETGKRRQDS